MGTINYPIGIQAFAELREDGYAYVDKTSYIYKLIESSKYVFLSRPRRFGKSLLLSTIHSLFDGRKDLFEGLEIAGSDYDWQPRPVIHIDFTGYDYSVPGSLENALNNIFERFEVKYGGEKKSRPLSERLEYIIVKAHEKSGHRVVVLIDEYDKALLETVDNPDLQEQFRNTLRGVYGNLKKLDEHIWFAMLTGVTKFGHLSIFSDLNNLRDISMVEEYAGICGITADELVRYFHEGVAELADQRGLSVDETYNRLKESYDGYHFVPEATPDIYNPFSLLNALADKRIRDYWFQTGTPTFLVKLIKSKKIDLQELDEVEIRASDVVSVSFDLKSSLYPVLYQTGYLTIKGYDERTDRLTLGFPNREVREGFLYQLYSLYALPERSTTEFDIAKFYRDVVDGNAEGFMIRLRSLFSSFPYDSFNLNDVEQHYQDVCYLVMKLLGFMTDVEYHTANGRIDMVVKSDRYIFVFEFKMDRTAEEAMAQINNKDYPLPFVADGRKIIKIGANFSSEKRTISDWIIEPM